MNIFAIVLGLIVFVNTIISIMLFITFVIFLTLWAYTDAKVRTLRPVFWTIIIVLTCFSIGLIVYLLIGRTVNEEEIPANKYKKPLRLTFLLAIISIVVNMIVMQLIPIMNQREGVLLYSGQFYNLQHSVNEQEWVISASEADGFLERNFYLSQSDLDNLATSIHLTEGDVAIGLLQLENNVLERFIISREPITTIYTTQFEPGMIRKFIYFMDVVDVNLVISWNADN